eukprot:335401_1
MRPRNPDPSRLVGARATGTHHHWYSNCQIIYVVGNGINQRRIIRRVGGGGGGGNGNGHGSGPSDSNDDGNDRTGGNGNGGFGGSLFGTGRTITMNGTTYQHGGRYNSNAPIMIRDANMDSAIEIMNDNNKYATQESFDFITDSNISSINVNALSEPYNKLCSITPTNNTNINIETISSVMDDMNINKVQKNTLMKIFSDNINNEEKK